MSKKTMMKIGSLSLPLDVFLTGTQTILAQKGKGKSYLAGVQCEELLEAGQQVVVIDPTGAWYGLRSSADGKGDGYPIHILGGDHGDVPLEATAGELVANAIATEHFSAVIDLSLFRKSESLRFMGAFLETLYRVNREALHLFIDEADVVAPQKTFSPEQARALGAAEDIVRRGRIRGIGCTLISQRAQVINKDVLTQADMLTTLGMNHPKDLQAIDAWVATHGDPKKAEQMIRELPSLPKGEAWVWSPSADLFRRVAIREKRTFDSGRTPKAGERVVTPKRLAEVDIQALGAAIAETVERAKATDPKHLRARVVELEKEVEKARSGKPAKPAKEVAVIKPSELKRMEAITKRLDARAQALELTVSRLGVEITTIKEIANRIRIRAEQLRSIDPFPNGRAIDAPPLRPSPADKPAPVERWQAPRTVPKETRRSAPASDASRSSATPDLAEGLEPRQLAVLESLAWWEAIGVSRPGNTGVAFVAGYSPSSSSYEKIRSVLKTGGFITYPTAGTLELTELGRQVAPRPETPTTRTGLHDAIRAKLEPRQVKVLDPLLDAYPNALTNDELATAAGYSADSSSYEKIRSVLVSLGLAWYPQPGHVAPTEVLFSC